MYVLALDWHGLVLVFEDLDAQPVGRVHIGLIEATIRPGLHRHNCGLPLGYLLLHIVYDEADVVHHGSNRWTIRRRRSRRLIQRDDDAGKHHAMEAASLEGFASHPNKNPLVGSNVLGIEMPMTVGHASFVERKGLRSGYARGQSEQQTSKNRFLHKCLP
jgi:hypothetical protein